LWIFSPSSKRGSKQKKSRPFRKGGIFRGQLKLSAVEPEHLELARTASVGHDVVDGNGFHVPLSGVVEGGGLPAAQMALGHEKHAVEHRAAGYGVQRVVREFARGLESREGFLQQGGLGFVFLIHGGHPSFPHSLWDGPIIQGFRGPCQEPDD